MFIVKIILPIKNIKKLIYYKKTNKNLNIGKRVIVPLKNKNIIGIITNICSKKKNIKIKKIIKIIDKKKIVNKKWLKLIKICSIYYKISFNIFLFNLIPRYTKKKYKKKIKYIEKIFTLTKISKKYFKIINKIHIKKKIWLLIANFKERINFYINIIKKNIQNNYQILILVPENYLIKKIKKYIYKKIYVNIKIINSKICKKKKIKIWKKILDEKISIILGTRSAIFTPFAKLNLIIIEEEHSDYYKENRNFPYNAKNIALIRAKIENIPIILGSLTPSIKSFYNSKIKKYNILKIKNKIYKIKKKVFNINNYIIKKKFLKILKKYIKKKKKIYILVNINGYSWLICKYCKSIQKCYLCKIKYILYKKKNKIICYKCKKKTVLKKCIKCKKNKFYKFGWGTKKIKQHLKKIFPLTKIEIITTNFKKNKKQQIFISHKLIINKKIPKPNLIILNIDNILFSHNYKSIEKIIRDYNIFIEKNYINKKQKLIFLTKYPNHYIFNNFLKFNHYEDYIKNILKERKLINYPPYVHESSISIRYDDNNIYKLYKTMNLLLHKHKKINILKPKLIKKKKLFWKIIIFTKLYKYLSLYIKDIKKKTKNKINFKIDIDNNE